MLNEFEESVWIARQVGVGQSEDDQWRAERIAMASFRKMLNAESSLRIASLTKPLECCGTQNLSLSLLTSNQISKSATSALHSSASKRWTPSSQSIDSANQRRSS